LGDEKKVNKVTLAFLSRPCGLSFLISPAVILDVLRVSGWLSVVCCIVITRYCIPCWGL